VNQAAIGPVDERPSPTTQHKMPSPTGNSFHPRIRQTDPTQAVEDDDGIAKSA